MSVRVLERSELALGAGLLGRGMCDNPIVIAAFGGSAEWRERVLETFFRTVLEGQFDRGQILGAFDGATLVGICGMARPGQCQPGVLEKMRVARSVLFRASPGVVIRIGQWTSEWSRRDPGTAHWHLGPIAVDRPLRGKGIGSEMLRDCCSRIDSVDAPAYLETDKEENVKFYQKHGFKVVGESAVLRQTNWYMSREPRRS